MSFLFNYMIFNIFMMLIEMYRYAGKLMFFSFVMRRSEVRLLLSAPFQSSSNKLFFHNNLLIFFLAYLFGMV